MTDSIEIFPPGFQVTNSTGAYQALAVLTFFDAGTSNARTVYSNSTLTTSLGTSVTCNSSGRPSSSGSEVLIYTGTTAYKVVAKTALAVLLWEFDNIKGALDTSTFLTGTVTAEFPVTNKTSDYPIVTADEGKFFTGNSTSGTITFTLPSAITVGTGWNVTVQHTGTANTVILASVGGQTIDRSTTQTLNERYTSITVVSDGANWHIKDTSQPPIAPWYSGHISGLILANNATDAVNDIDIAVGSAATDDTVPSMMVLSTAITKRLDAAWAVGTGNGGRDTGAIANTTYHVYLIRRIDTGVVDVLFSTSATSPTMPSNYTQKRRIGSIVRAAATIKAFEQLSDGKTRVFYWDVIVSDVALTTPGTAAVTNTLTLPTGIEVEAIIAAKTVDTASGSTTHTLLTSLDQTDTVPSATLFSYTHPTAGGAQAASGTQARVFTNTSGQIRSRCSFSSATLTFSISTVGWVDYV